jgi:hypothetical protein
LSENLTFINIDLSIVKEAPEAPNRQSDSEEA